MRTFILIALALSLHAAVPKAKPLEEFKLTDGRTLVGTYDDEAGVLTLDGGKASLQIKEEQIAERKKAIPKEVVEAPKPAAKPLTDEQKAERAAAVAAGQKEAARERLIGEANKAERDAKSYDQKAKGKRDQALRDAKKFSVRAKQEGAQHSIESILGGPVTLRDTAATNEAILELMKEAKEYDGLAAAQRKTSAEKRAAAGNSP